MKSQRQITPAESDPASTFMVDIWEHAIGDDDCDDCWRGYPVLCECGGLIHADWGDETGDGYWLYTKCDKCGEPE